MAQRALQNLAANVKKFFGPSESSGSGTQQEIVTVQSPKIAIDKIHFLHLRRRDAHGNILPHGGATIAYKVSHETIDEVADSSDPNTAIYFLDIGIAKCRASPSSSDMFCKRIGRDIATARLLDCVEGYTYIVHPTKQQVIKAVKEHYYHQQEEFEPQIRVTVR